MFAFGSEPQSRRVSQKEEEVAPHQKFGPFQKTFAGQSEKQSSYIDALLHEEGAEPVGRDNVG